MRTIYTPSKIEKQDEDNLWQSAIIVFDTCALLDFYFLTPEYQEIMAEILEHLETRIWIPAQVYPKFRCVITSIPSSRPFLQSTS